MRENRLVVQIQNGPFFPMVRYEVKQFGLRRESSLSVNRTDSAAKERKERTEKSKINDKITKGFGRSAWRRVAALRAVSRLWF
jgi:hypothetical protein